MVGFNSYMTLLNKSEVKNIHEASKEILKNTGMMFADKRFLKALDKKGAIVDYTNFIVKFPEKLLNETTEAIKKDYSEETQLGFYGDGSSKTGYLWGGGPAIFYLDYENQDLRRGTENDALSIIRFADTVKQISEVCNTMLVYDADKKGNSIDPKLWTIKSTALTAKNTCKFSYSENIHSVKELEFIRQIGEVILEDPQKIKERPPFSITKCAISPLKLEKNECEILYYLATNGFMCGLGSMPIAGATAPATLAGTIVLTNAEMLAMGAAIKAINPKTRVYFVSFLSIMDMKSGNISYGAPESLLQNIGFQEFLSHIYNVKPHLNSFYLDGKLPGVQSAMERTVYNLSSIAFGMKALNDFGSLYHSQIISLEQAVVDLERTAWMEKFCKGIEINDETLAVDAIKRVGIGGNYLADIHTIKHFRDEFWIPKITDRAVAQELTLKSYLESDMLKTAQKKVRNILKDYEPYSVDNYKAEEIDRIVKEAEDYFLRRE